MPTLPPRRIVAPTQPATPPPSPEPSAPAEATTAETPQAAEAAAPPAKKAAPVKTAKPPKPPAIKNLKKALPKKAKAVPKRAVKSSPRSATENVVPKVSKVKSRIWSEEAVELGTIIVDMKKITPAISKDRIELRSVSDRLQVLFNEKLGINCRKVYSADADVAKIVKFLQRVPEELMPAKWPTAIERIEKYLAKA